MDLSQWKNRAILLLFTPSPKDLRFARQVKTLREFRDRLTKNGALQISVFAQGGFFEDGQLGSTPLSAEDAVSLREQHGLEKDDFYIYYRDVNGRIGVQSRAGISAEALKKLLPDPEKKVGRR